ncbi:hypothetical protein L2K20_12725 [Mycobacterium sp. MBM]|nr:hypothetical protein [Mycobacterium sp. MBM]
MSLLALLLVAVGIGDMVRRPAGSRWLPPVLCVGTLVAGAMLAGMWRTADLALLALASIVGAGWLVESERADRAGTRQARPLLILGAGVGASILLSGLPSEAGGLIGQWLVWVGASVPADLALMALGVLAVQVSTANQVVRLILASVGAVKPAGQPQPSDQLKGGRLLGSMERLLIVGLGLAGQLTLATAVVAAKSIIRFPEISAKRDPDAGRVGIDDVTEYFLVGSFASWIVAFTGLALVSTTA